MFWVDLFADGNLTTPGVYAATVNIVFATHSTHQISLTVQRRNFSLPTTSKRYQTAYGCSTSGILAGRYGNHEPSHWPPEVLANMQRQYVELGLMHRISFSDFLKVGAVHVGCGEGENQCESERDLGLMAVPSGRGAGRDGAEPDTTAGQLVRRA